MSNQRMIGVEGDAIFEVLRLAQEHAERAAATMPGEPTAAPTACLTILATALNMVIRISADVIDDEQHQLIAAAADQGATVGLMILQRKATDKAQAEAIH